MPVRLTCLRNHLSIFLLEFDLDWQRENLRASATTPAFRWFLPTVHYVTRITVGGVIATKKGTPVFTSFKRFKMCIINRSGRGYSLQTWVFREQGSDTPYFVDSAVLNSYGFRCEGSRVISA